MFKMVFQKKGTWGFLLCKSQAGCCPKQQKDQEGIFKVLIKVTGSVTQITASVIRLSFASLNSRGGDTPQFTSTHTGALLSARSLLSQLYYDDESAGAHRCACRTCDSTKGSSRSIWTDVYSFWGIVKNVSWVSSTHFIILIKLRSCLTVS